MKRYLFILVANLMVLTINAQKDFQWDVVDSVAKAKDQLYSETKSFISEYWKSAKDVIQNDDKDGGIILVKGVSIQEVNFAMNPHTYIYSYTVKFMVKDNKFRIVISDVQNTSSTCMGNVWPLVPPSDNTTDKIGKMPTAKRVEMMDSLRKELQGMVDNYEKTIKTPTKGW